MYSNKNGNIILETCWTKVAKEVGVDFIEKLHILNLLLLQMLSIHFNTTK